MGSFEVMRKTIAKAGVKSVASDLALSQSLVYKWCQAKGDAASGADNPLDRIVALCRITGDPAPIQWLCEQVNGYFVENIVPDEARSIRVEWEDLKRVAEKFALGCEMGRFSPQSEVPAKVEHHWRYR